MVPTGIRHSGEEARLDTARMVMMGTATVMREGYIDNREENETMLVLLFIMIMRDEGKAG